jgi:hypothetical protein
MRTNFDRQAIISVLFCLVLWVQTVYAEDIDSAQKINDVVCIFIYAVEATVGAIASIVIVFLGLKYLTSGDDSDARYMARIGIISAFVGIVIVVIAVPFVNLVASGLLDTVDCGYFPSISGGGGHAALSPVTPDNGGGSELKDPYVDVAAMGFSLTKSVEDIKKPGNNEFPLFIQLSNVGTKSSVGFTSTVSMSVGLGLGDDMVLCNVPVLSLPPDGKIRIYPCNGADIAKVKDFLSRGKTVTLTLKADPNNDAKEDESKRNNNVVSQDISRITPNKIDETQLGPTGGLIVNNVGGRTT